jgi:uroporphyrinogen-III synthase
MPSGKLTTTDLAGRAILVASDDTPAEEIARELKLYGARVIVCPQSEIAEPDSYTALDEAIQNLFGYDWLIFTNVHGVDSLLRRFQALGKENNDLDAVRVCAVGEVTAGKLEESHIHVDLIPARSQTIFAALETYTGGRDLIRGLNFLMLRAAIARDSLLQTLEDAGARVDLVTAYRTVGSNSSELTQLNALLNGGGIDCLAFTSPSAVENFAQLFDSKDLSQLLKDVAVACCDDQTAKVAAEFGLRCDISPAELTVPALARAIASYFSC